MAKTVIRFVMVVILYKFFNNLSNGRWGIFFNYHTDSLLRPPPNLPTLLAAGKRQAGGDYIAQDSPTIPCSIKRANPLG